MNKHVAAESRRLLSALEGIIRTSVTRSGYEVSTVERDGSVLVRFREAGTLRASSLASAFRGAMDARRIKHAGLDAVRFRLGLQALRPLL